MKVYELKMIEGGKGVFKVSTVKDPAIEDTLLYFTSDKKNIEFFALEEKRIFYAPAMIPNKMIYRSNINGEPAQVYYTEETVVQAQTNYFRNNGNISNNINHSEESDAQGLFPIESWIVQDFNTDKAKTLGFNVPNGTWMMGYKVDNDAIWNDVKAGKLDGLSVEMTHLNKEFKKEITMSKDKEEKSVLDTIFDFIFNMKKEKDEVEKMEVEPVVEEVTVEEPVVEAVEMAKEEEVEEPKEEEKPKEEMAEAPIKDEEVVEDSEEVKALKDELLTLKQTIAELEADKVKEGTELENMKAQIVEFQKQTPAAKSIKDLPKVETFTAEEQKLIDFKRKHGIKI